VHYEAIKYAFVTNLRRL